MVTAVETALSRDNEQLIHRGVVDFLEALVRLWDVLDAALLQSGYAEAA